MNKQERILVDVGSSTIKAYHYYDKLNLLVQESVHFKDGFTPQEGLREIAKKRLFDLINAIREENKILPIKTYATGIFRKLESKAKLNLIDEFFEKTGVFLNIIPQELENFYLETALMGKFLSKEPVLLINIGGGSTELVVTYGKEAVERINLEFGVGNINTYFEGINNQLSSVKIEDIIDYVKSKLPELLNKPRIAFYTGGELNYMKLAGYPLLENNLFQDDEHPFIILIEEFSKKNKEVFESISLNDLELLMPQNLKWMHGARGCSAIAQAICEKYGVKTIIPSDSNLINGVVRQEFRTATLSGSFRKHLNYILEFKKELENNGVKILSPRFIEPKNSGEEFVVFSGEEGLSPLQLERHHLESILNSDALVVCSPGGYVGASALLEIGFAHAIGKRIIFTEKPEEFMLNTLPAEIGL